MRTRELKDLIEDYVDDELDDEYEEWFDGDEDEEEEDDEEEAEEKEVKITPKRVTVELSPGYVDKLKNVLNPKEYDAVRDQIELGIMRNVKQMPGNNILEKIDNYNDYCEVKNITDKMKKNDKKKEIKITNYRIKHRGIYG